MKVLDPQGIRQVPISKLLYLLEILARGSTTEEMTLVSKTYALEVLELFT